jgi:hypothetical protein
METNIYAPFIYSQQLFICIQVREIKATWLFRLQGYSSIQSKTHKVLIKNSKRLSEVNFIMTRVQGKRGYTLEWNLKFQMSLWRSVKQRTLNINWQHFQVLFY